MIHAEFTPPYQQGTSFSSVGRDRAQGRKSGIVRALGSDGFLGVTAGLLAASPPCAFFFFLSGPREFILFLYF